MLQKSVAIQPFLVLASYMGLYFFSQFHRTAIGPLAGEFMREFVVTASGVGVLASSYFVIYGLLQLVYGAAIDRCGSNKIVLLTMPMHVIACFLFASASSFEMLVASRVVIAVAIAPVYIAGLKATALTFGNASYGKVVGIYTGWGYTASLLGMVIPSLMLGRGLGWRQTFVFLSLASLFFYLFFALLVVPRTKRPTLEASSEHGSFNLRLLFTSDLALIYFTAAVAYGSYVGLVSWMPKYLYDVFGFGRDVSGIVSALPAAMMAIGSPIMGVLADRTSSWNRIFKYSYLFTTLLLASLLYAVIIGDVLLALIFFSSGILSLSGFTIWPVILRKERGESNLALLLSLVNTFVFIGAFTYPAVMGLVMDYFTPKMIVAGERIYGVEAYLWAFIFCFSTVAVSAALIFKRMK